MPSFLSVPREPLARFRLLALWLALIFVLGNGIATALMGHPPINQVVIGVSASLALAAWWAYGYSRGAYPLAGWLLDAVLVLAAALTSPLPVRAIGVFFTGLQLRALHSRRRDVLPMIAAYSGTRVIALLVAPIPDMSSVWTTVVLQGIGLAVIGLSLIIFVAALERQEETERELQRSDERYRLLASASRDVFFDFDVSTRMVEWSESMLTVFGYYPAEVGRDARWWLERVHPDDRSDFMASSETFMRDPARRLNTFRYRFERADGTYAFVSGTGLMQRDPAGQPRRIIGAIRDVTVETQLAEQLRQSQKMEAVGQLAGGVAHDFNNLLTVVGGHVYMLQHILQPSENVEKHLQGITKTADRAAQLTKQLLAFSRRQLLKPAIINVNMVVDEVLEMIRPALDESIEIETRLDPLLAPVLADSGQLVQVLVNLALNSRDAMSKGGTLTIETTNATIEGAVDAASDSSLPTGEYVKLIVRDTGVGMTKETLARVFEPFFTTKSHGSGTGLGLATAYGIIKQSLGDIRAESTLGAGSVFTVLLPAVRRSVEPTAATLPQRPIERTGDRQNVLLVEDDAGVREFVREILSSAGYTVHQAADGVIGLEVARSMPTIDVVVTDVVMPRMGGRAMVDELRRSRPNLRVLYMTGYTDHAEMLEELRATDAHLLEKPFGARALASAVANVAAGAIPSSSRV